MTKWRIQDKLLEVSRAPGNATEKSAAESLLLEMEMLVKQKCAWCGGRGHHPDNCATGQRLILIGRSGAAENIVVNGVYKRIKGGHSPSQAPYSRLPANGWWPTGRKRGR